MDERAIKKLALILVVAIAIILVFKFMLTRTYSNLNKLNSAKIPHPVVVVETRKFSDEVPASAVMPPPAVEPLNTVEQLTAEPVSAVANVPADQAQSP